MFKIVEIVVECCAMRVDFNGKMSVTVKDVLGKSREQNVVMTRCILVRILFFFGFSPPTAAMLLHRTTPAIRHLLKTAQDYHASSFAYRTAELEAEKKCKELLMR